MRGCMERSWHRACTSPALSTRELLGRLSSLCPPHRALRPGHLACSSGEWTRVHLSPNLLDTGIGRRGSRISPFSIRVEIQDSGSLLAGFESVSQLLLSCMTLGS